MLDAEGNGLDQAGVSAVRRSVGRGCERRGGCRCLTSAGIFIVRPPVAALGRTDAAEALLLFQAVTSDILIRIVYLA